MMLMLAKLKALPSRHAAGSPGTTQKSPTQR
jgi:hypothetical protein